MSGSYIPKNALWLAWVAPIVVAVAGYFLAPVFTTVPEAHDALRQGVYLGAGVGGFVAFGLGLWTLQSCKKRNAAFLAPVALGFLVKAVGLALGTWLCFRFVGQGSHFAYAVCFVTAAFAWQLIFTPSLLQMRGRAANDAEVAGAAR